MFPEAGNIIQVVIMNIVYFSASGTTQKVISTQPGIRTATGAAPVRRSVRWVRSLRTVPERQMRKSALPAQPASRHVRSMPAASMFRCYPRQPQRALQRTMPAGICENYPYFSIYFGYILCFSRSRFLGFFHLLPWHPELLLLLLG